MTLTWREATVGDKPALSQFECTRREKRLGRWVYPRPWERQVESTVREVNPRCGPGAAILLGTDEYGIGAVVSVGERGTDGPMIEMIAVANRLRFQGGAAADEALDEAVQWFIRRHDPLNDDPLTIFADFDPRNHASRTLLKRYGFRLLQRFDHSEAWVFDPPPVML